MNLTRKEPIPVTKSFCIMCDKEIKNNPVTVEEVRDHIFFEWNGESTCFACHELKKEAQKLTDLVNANLHQDTIDAYETERHFYNK